MANVFGGTRQALPTPRPPASMPDPDNPAIVEAKRRDLAERLSQGGRESTILTGRRRQEQNFDTYTSLKLGAS